MSLLHICCNWASTTVYDSLFAQLAKLGVEQSVYVPEKHFQNIGVRRPSDSSVKVIASLIVRPWDRALYHTKANRVLPDLLAKVPLQGVNFVHAHTLFTDGGIAYRLYQRKGLPFMVSLRNTDINYFFRYMPHLRRHGHAILLAAKYIVCISPAHRRLLLEKYIPDQIREQISPKIVVIPNGIEEAWLENVNPKTYTAGAPIHIAFAGKLNADKQPMRALQAIKEMQRLLPEVRCTLSIAGDGPLLGVLQKTPQVKSGMVQLLGKLQGLQAMKSFYAQATVFLLPSLHETFGLVYLEAMSQGVPVLYTKGQGFDEQFDEGEAGYVIDPKDARQIARTAVRLLDDYNQRSTRCIQLAGQLTWPKVAKQYRKIYEHYA